MYSSLLNLPDFTFHTYQHRTITTMQAN